MNDDWHKITMPDLEAAMGRSGPNVQRMPNVQMMMPKPPERPLAGVWTANVPLLNYLEKFGWDSRRGDRLSVAVTLVTRSHDLSPFYQALGSYAEALHHEILLSCLRLIGYEDTDDLYQEVVARTSEKIAERLGITPFLD